MWDGVDNRDLAGKEFDDIMENVVLVNGIIICYMDGKNLAVLPLKDRLEYAINTHRDHIVGHVGLQKVEERINDVAYVKDLTDILKLVETNCGRCF